MAAKRLTDTGKWEQAWFRQLSPKLKTINDYICDKCDHAGIWEIDLETLSFFVNEKTSDGVLIQVTLNEIFQAFNGKVRLVRNDKLFLEGSALFQYKLKSLADLKFTNNAHLSAISILEKYGIIRVDRLMSNVDGTESTPFITVVEPQQSPSSGAHGGVGLMPYYQDKDMVKDKVKDGDKDKEASESKKIIEFEKLKLAAKTATEPVGGPATETKDTLGPIEEFSKSEILRPVLAGFSKSAQRQIVMRYKDVPWIIGQLEDAVAYYTATGQENSKTWGKLLVLWLKRAKDKPHAFKVASGLEKDPFEFNPYPDDGGEG